MLSCFRTRFLCSGDAAGVPGISAGSQLAAMEDERPFFVVAMYRHALAAPVSPMAVCRKTGDRFACALSRSPPASCSLPRLLRLCVNKLDSFGAALALSSQHSEVLRAQIKIGGASCVPYAQTFDSEPRSDLQPGSATWRRSFRIAVELNRCCVTSIPDVTPPVLRCRPASRPTATAACARVRTSSSTSRLATTAAPRRSM